MKNLCIVTLLSVFLAPLCAWASSGYAVDNQSNLYRINLTTAAVTTIGYTGVFLEGLALSPGGQLFGTDSGGGFWQINKATGAATYIGNTLRGDIEGLHFNGTQLLGVSLDSNPPQIFSINLKTAATTNIVTAQRAISGAARAMTVLDSNHVLISAGSPDTNIDHGLYSINLTTGDVELLAQLNLGTTAYLAGLDFDPQGNLYGLDGAGDIWLIDLANSHVTLIGTYPTYWLDLAAST
jgi:hypothetical protein